MGGELPAKLVDGRASGRTSWHAGAGELTDGQGLPPPPAGLPTGMGPHALADLVRDEARIARRPALLEAPLGLRVPEVQDALGASGGNPKGIWGRA